MQLQRLYIVTLLYIVIWNYFCVVSNTKKIMMDEGKNIVENIYWHQLDMMIALHN